MKKFAVMTLFAGLCAIFGCSAKGFESVGADEFARKIAKEGVQLVDVRTASEYAEGHIPNAVLIPEYEVADRAENELTDKNQLVVFCQSRNAHSAVMLNNFSCAGLARRELSLVTAYVYYFALIYVIFFNGFFKEFHYSHFESMFVEVRHRVLFLFC